MPTRWSVSLLTALVVLALAAWGCASPMAPTDAPVRYTCEVLIDRCVPMTGLPEGMAGMICTLRIERVVQTTPCEPWADPKVPERRRTGEVTLWD